MYVVFTKEVADVDSSEFDKIGHFDRSVVAVPCGNVNLSVKGQRGTELDEIEDCQNSLVISYEATEDLEIELRKDPLVPSVLYRRNGQDFAELRYERRLGALVFHVFFLIDVDYCYFGHHEDGEIHFAVDLAYLWKEGLIRRVTS